MKMGHGKAITMIGVGAILAGFQAVHAADLTVAIEGVKDNRGLIGCALYNKAEGFTKMGSAIALTGEKASPKGNTCHFAGLPAGTYAVAVLHDNNSNKKMDLSMLGLPEEDWGMSNNVRPGLRAPTFKESAFSIQSDPVNITIRLAR
jgi:uncharacterized protein (DUF2141 family)